MELEVSTIQGYRADIIRVINLSGGRNISDDQHLNALISNFSIKRPFKKKIYPCWDLMKVLKTLMEELYESLNTISLPFLTKETVFLLLLASGLKRNYIIWILTSYYYLRMSLLLRT